MSSTKPPWPATAGLIIVSISSCTLVLRSSLMVDPPLRGTVPAFAPRSNANVLAAGPGHLARGGLRSAEPGLGETRRASPLSDGHWRRPQHRLARGLIRQACDGGERHRRVLTTLGGARHGGAHVGVQMIHPRVGMGPSVIEGVGHELAEMWPHGGALEQE